MNVELRAWIFWSGWSFWCAAADLYSSTDHVTQLISTERTLAAHLHLYTNALRDRADLLTRALESLDKGHGAHGDPEKITSNPLEAYQLVRRLSQARATLMDALEQTTAEDALLKLRSVARVLPTTEDVDGVVIALIRLQKMYQLDARNISCFSEMSHGVSLAPEEALDVALISYGHGHLQHAVQWLEETFLKLTNLNPQEILPTLISSLQPFPAHVDLPGPSLITGFLWGRHVSVPVVDGSYEALCTGKGGRKTPKRNLVCRYKRGYFPLTYVPFKEEVEWEEPLILRYHHFLTNEEMDSIKTLARPKLSRAKVLDPVTGEKVSAGSRVAQSAWLPEDDAPVIGQLNQRVADVTGLRMEMAEELQVANYGIGGQYEPHYDSKLVKDSDFERRGGRIATVLIYMSDVDIGGSTVFPHAGVALKPQKGSAVFWFNLMRNGEEDGRTLHASCPVFVGSKWVANKWIRSGGQEFRRKCSTNPFV